MVRVSDKESFNTARALAREEGLLVGGSAGTAVAAALKYAQRLEKPKYIVAILPDTGRNYLTKIFSDSWMQENGFWQEGETTITRVREILAQKKELPPIISVGPGDVLSAAARLMDEFNISQLPVVDGGGVVGSLDEASLMKLLYDGVDFGNQQVSAVMGRPLPVVDEELDAAEAYRLLLSGTSAVVVVQAGAPVGVITRADLINYWIGRRNGS
jgi:cystathionine beta-synthase